MAPFEIVLRLADSAAVGFIFGIEREAHGRAAGLRTTIRLPVVAIRPCGPASPHAGDFSEPERP